MLTAQDAVKLEAIQAQAEHLVSYAAKLGVIVTIEQRPLTPLAMGRYETVVSVRPVRK